MFIRFTEVLIALAFAIIATLPVEQPVARMGEGAMTASVQSARTDVNKTSAPVDSAVLAVGPQVYLDNYCGVCHSLTIVDAGGMFGPSHDRMGAIAEERLTDTGYRGNAASAVDYIRESILEPSVYIAPGSMIAHQQMPPYTHLPVEEIDALVLFLVQQR